MLNTIMPRQQTQRQKQLSRARLTGQTKRPSDFKKIIRSTDRQWSIISQGDSWFDYPRELVNFQHANIMDHIVSKLFGKANFLRLEDSGAEAQSLAQDDEFDDFEEGLQVDKLDFVLLSMGGNDFAGEDDIGKHILSVPIGDPSVADSYVNKSNVASTINQIKNAYIRHLEAVKKYHPKAHVITHTYDYFQPSDIGIRILWDCLQIMGPWVSIGMQHVPTSLQLDIVKWLMDENKKMLLALANAYDNFYVVDTHGTLIPNDRQDWLDEIHPTPKGFAKISDKIYCQMRLLDPLVVE